MTLEFGLSRRCQPCRTEPFPGRNQPPIKSFRTRTYRTADSKGLYPLYYPHLRKKGGASRGLGGPSSQISDLSEGHFGCRVNAVARCPLPLSAAIMLPSLRAPWSTRDQ